MRRRLLLQGAIWWTFLTFLAAAEIGPSRGALVIVGGGMQDEAILERFFDLAGGWDAPTVIIPTAGDEAEYDESWGGLRRFRNAGATNLTLLHTRDRNLADSASFCEPIRQARAVFFTG